MRSEFCTFDTELSTLNSQPGLCSWSVHAASLEMQTHQECPPRPITSLECTLTKNGFAGSLEWPVTNSLDLNSPGIRASWPLRGAEVLWRSSTAVTRLECTDTKNGLASSLECTDTNSLDLNFRGITLFQKKRGGGSSLPSLLPLPPSAGRQEKEQGRSTAGLEVRPEPAC